MCPAIAAAVTQTRARVQWETVFGILYARFSVRGVRVEKTKTHTLTKYYLYTRTHIRFKKRLPPVVFKPAGVRGENVLSAECAPFQRSSNARALGELKRKTRLAVARRQSAGRSIFVCRSFLCTVEEKSGTGTRKRIKERPGYRIGRKQMARSGGGGGGGRNVISREGHARAVRLVSFYYAAYWFVCQTVFSRTTTD